MNKGKNRQRKKLKGNPATENLRIFFVALGIASATVKGRTEWVHSKKTSNKGW